MLPKTVVKRVPKAAEMLKAFIRHIVKSSVEPKISGKKGVNDPKRSNGQPKMTDGPFTPLSGITSLGQICFVSRGLGGHLAGYVGNKLKKDFPGEIIATIWGKF